MLRICPQYLRNLVLVVCLTASALVSITGCSQPLADEIQFAAPRLSLSESVVEEIDAFDVVVESEDGERIETRVGADEREIALEVPAETELSVELHSMREKNGVMVPERFTGSETVTLPAGSEEVVTVAVELVEPQYAETGDWVGSATATDYDELEAALEEAEEKNTDDDAFLIVITDDITDGFDAGDAFAYVGDADIYLYGYAIDEGSRPVLDAGAQSQIFFFQSVGGGAPSGVSVSFESLHFANGLLADSNDFDGGAIAADNSVALNVYDSEFTNNETEGGGGAIEMPENGSILHIYDSTFTGNRSELTGGAVRMFGLESELYVENTEFSGNIGSSGGAISTQGVSTSVTDSLFEGNDADDFGFGGAIRSDNHGGDGGAITIENSEFVENSASNEGGAVRSQDGGTEVTGSEFIANEAPIGGALTATDELYVSASRFESNFAFEDGPNEGAGAIQFGSGGAADKESALTIVDSEFIENETEGDSGGAIAGSGDIAEGSEDDVVISVEDSYFESNRYSVNGDPDGGASAIFSESLNEDILTSNSRYVDHEAPVLNASGGELIDEGGNEFIDTEEPPWGDPPD